MNRSVQNTMTRYKLKDIAIITIGSAIPDEQYFSTVGVPFVSLESLDMLTTSDSLYRLPRINAKFEEELKLIKVPSQTILFFKDATQNYIYQCEGEVYIANNVRSIIPNKSIILNEYLLYFLKWYSANQGLKDVCNITIDVPKVSIQFKIIQLLNASQLLLKNRENLMTALDAYPMQLHHAFQQMECNKQQLNYSFEQVGYLRNMLLDKAFKGNILRGLYH